MKLHPEYLVDSHKRRKAVLLPVAEWEQVLVELEELADIRAYDAAKAGPQESITLAQATHELGLGNGQ